MTDLAHDSTLLKGLRVRQFFDSEAKALRERFRIIETLIPSSSRQGSSNVAEEGRHIESLLRDFLNRHLPKSLRAVSGFILRPATKIGIADASRLTENDEHSSQLDIIVYDFSNFPVYEHFEEFVIVPPEGVVGVISVKKNLRSSDLNPELQALERAAALCKQDAVRGPHVALFAFTSSETSNEKLGADIFKRVSEVSAGKTFALLVNEVAVFDKVVVFKFSPGDSPPGTARYVRVDCIDSLTKDSLLHIPLQRMIQSLLSVYYDPTRDNSKRPGFVSFRRRQFKDSPLLGDIPVSSEQ